MTVELFLSLLAVLSIITSLLTEGVKKLFNSMKWNYASNIIVLCVSVVVGGCGTSIFYLFNHYEFTTLNIICIILMIVANWLASMLGYDKVMQAFAQIKK